MKIGAFFIFTLFAVTGHSQNTINSYKYILVPQRFDFLKMDDQYGLNTTTKTLLQQKGFTVFWSNGNLPPAVAANKCTAIVAEVVQRKAFFTTNLTVLLKDCSGNIIFKTKEGKSREKEFDLAYDEALKDAFSSLNNVPYKYDSTLTAASQPAPTQPQSVTTQPQTVTSSPALPTSVPASATLYAQAIPNGYQLIDTTPKKVLTLLKTSMPDYFLADDEASHGVVFKKNGEWLFEYYKGDKLVSQRLEIKF